MENSFCRRGDFICENHFEEIALLDVVRERQITQILPFFIAGKFINNEDVGSVLLHQPLIRGNITGPATDLQIEAEEMLRVQARLYRIISSHTGKAFKQIEEDCDRNYWLDASQSVEYGVIDKVLEKLP